MKSCRSFEALLASFANQELSAAQAKRLTQHLAQCERCEREVQTFRRLAVSIKGMPAPEVPEQALQGFAREIMEQISPPEPRRLALLQDWLSSLFRPRWRYAWATAAIVGFMLVLGLWYVPFERKAAPHLTELLQARAWDKLYYALSHEETRVELLHQRVPAELLKTTLRELLTKSKRDLRWRAGIQKLVAAISNRKPEPRVRTGSAKIMGVITAQGYVPTQNTRGNTNADDVLVREVEKLSPGVEVTLAQLMNLKN